MDLKIKYTAPSKEHWDVPEVGYRGEIVTYRVFGEMAPSMTQDKLAEFDSQEKPKGNPHPMDSVLHYAIASAAHKLRNESPQEAEKLRTFLQQGCRRYPHTLTRIAYNPSGNDRIIHNYGTLDQYSLEGDVVGKDGLITDISDKKVLELFLGTENVSEINEIAQWINGTNSSIWRLNSKPKQREERVVGFGACSYRFDLNVLRGPLVGYPAFLVSRVE